MAPVVEVTDVSHSSSLLVQLNEQRLRGQFCDITIIAEDTKFKAHKNVLAASSPYFKEVLSEESVCLQPSQILELPDIQAEVFSDILNFIYNSRLSVPSSAAAKEIGAVGRRLGISRLENLDDPSADTKMDNSSPVSSRPCNSPIDLTCPSRSTEPSSPLCFQDLAKASSPVRETRPETETETAKILYNLSSVATVPPPPQSDLAYMLKGSVGWDHDNSPGNSSLATTNKEVDQGPASSCSPPSGASYPASSTFCCGICSRSFTTSSALSLHMKLHRTRRSLSCRHCGKSFIHIKRLQTHEVLCKEVEKPEEGASVGETQPNPVLPSKPTATPTSSKKGMMFRHRGLPRVDYISDQDHFVKVVDGHIIYFCTVCERSYMTLSSLKRHSNVHSWRRKYPCRYCDKVFALAEYRTKHEVWHTGERRYQCIFCWETFVTYYNLKTHQKAFHGINPGLISSEKTPNGGYKPKLNALKLYRLLPMRSQKRPYKTYSQGLVPDNLLLPAQPIPMALGDGDSLDGNLVSSLGSSDVPSVFTTSSLELPEAQRFQKQESVVAPEIPTLPTTGEKGQSDKRPGPLNAEAPSVIAYGRPASSVIVHSTSVMSQTPSVITYNSKSSDAPLDKGSLSPQSQPPPSTVVAKPIKKQVLKEYMQSQKVNEQALEENGNGHRARGARSGRTMTYMAKPAYVGTASESRAAPLCQITVRIGEEAIVKRRISETDLMLDKGGRVGGKRFDFGRDQTEEKQLPLQLAPHGKHTSRMYANESGEEESDRGDTEDQLWRPYYSYKPKRKASGGGGSNTNNAGPKMKKSRWRRKLRSLRWVKRTEKAEEAEGREEEEQEEASVGTSEPVPAEVSGGFGATPETEGMNQPLKAGSGRGSEWKHECSVCGKLFSALKKLRKHERVHGRLGKDDQSPTPLQGTPHRVGRKPLVKFTCAHCAKVCKTAAALSRHMKRHEGEQLEQAPLPALATVIAYSKKTADPAPSAPSPVIKEETTQEMQVSSSSGEAPTCQQDAPGEEEEEGPVAMETQPYPGRTPAPMPEEETVPLDGGNKPPFPEEVPVHPPPPEATASLAEMPPSLPHSLQDPVISHTGLVQKEDLAPPPEVEGERYPVQEYPLPLLVPGSCRTRKDLEDKPSFLAYPSTIQFNAVGKAGGSDGDGKVCFYPDPYPLMYGHQLLAAYPYNFSLPVALNMVVPDDKGQPLPFLPSVFGYSMNPCRSEAHDGGTGSTMGMPVGASTAHESRGELPAPERLKKRNLL
ncbi:zinc finger and BTB domain-containing protein 4 [Rhineura floridana]|uniref:zinc finger and BTB domain-containing protein 4 n=1 Tax=Rhineura floridana TaxID=261503 RepID=UPI002AC84124|nr:zinc finger and BTB domain-containing protein 4 [Rhineura floridana]XP_061446724.1 zinc finger and BTB domain-containing protein 4 [Rhineura floridana]XP_061446725.1 zinc finger and BTB domain-containing protein 4 [Rhineura floridana]XP_061446726.1 zinc finger and BTB domain-containing protein 4 [Rhineura floridana]XP_061446727.1 zinc finger and BTB domain-containing protein 4 [Rhineura floridana]XP_061446728.1 zinc finger and BTB domain-containing protein 4 [Rhineura floridana]